MRSRLFIVLLVAPFFLAFSFNIHRVHAQIEPQKLTPIECGQILEAENNPSERFQDYQIMVPAGTILNGRVEPVGSTFNVVIWFADAGGSIFGGSNDKLAGLAEEFIDLSLGSSNPILRVRGTRPDRDYWSGNCFSCNENYYGAYTIYLGCTLRDGTRIEPGQAASEVQPPPNAEASNSNASISITSTPSFTGYGFRGLPSVDFSSAFILPYTVGTLFPGQIPATGPGVIGFTLNATANDILDLKFDRTSGNLNLGVVVLFGQDQVLFYGGLIASNTLSTTLTLPSDGQYTIGVFRVDLVPPAAPEATAFQVLGTLNP
jgi:hypothetical protein